MPPAVAASVPTDGANAAERVQELSITVMLADLDSRAASLRPATVREVLDAFLRLDASSGRDKRTLRDDLRATYTVLSKLDRYERLLLLRYVKREFATELERRLFIAIDIIRSPDLDPSIEVDVIKNQIRTEELQLQGMVYDRNAQCEQIGVLLRLNHQRVAAEFELATPRIAASNVSVDQRERALEDARRARRSADDALDRTWGTACSEQRPNAPDMFSSPHYHSVRRSTSFGGAQRRRPRRSNSIALKPAYDDENTSSRGKVPCPLSVRMAVHT